CPPGSETGSETGNGGGNHGGGGGGTMPTTGGICPACGSGEGGGGEGDCREGTGMPRWSVSEPALNLFLRDTPISYRPGRGPQGAFKLVFKSERNTQHGEDLNKSIFSIGRGWSTPWRSYVRDEDGNTNTFKFANGRSGYSSMSNHVL